MDEGLSFLHTQWLNYESLKKTGFGGGGSTVRSSSSGAHTIAIVVRASRSKTQGKMWSTNRYFLVYGSSLPLGLLGPEGPCHCIRPSFFAKNSLVEKARGFTVPSMVVMKVSRKSRTLMKKPNLPVACITLHLFLEFLAASELCHIQYRGVSRGVEGLDRYLGSSERLMT